MEERAAQGPLSGLRIVESTAFIAAPLATMSLAALGAEVIRLDAAEGGLDYGRWPLAPSGRSLYWSMLNRGKRSVTLDLRTEAGRDAAADLICDGSGEGGGIFVTNLPAKGPLTPAALLKRRPDCIVVTLDGSPDGTSAIDYTVHAACGAAMMTGAEGFEGPLNNAVPYWDVICGRTLGMGILAAVIDRMRTGRGQHLAVSLSDIAMETMANLGITGEAEITGRARPRQGNWIYGSFGRDFRTGCGRWFMVVAVTAKQWRALVAATGLALEVARIEADLGVTLEDEHARHAAREVIGVALARWAEARDLEAVARTFAGTAVCWSPYRDSRQMLDEDPRAGEENPLFGTVDHPGIGVLRTPRSPVRMSGWSDLPAMRAPVLGEDTDAVLGGSDREGDI